KMGGEVVFENCDGLALAEAEERLRRACCEENNFNARQVGVPEVYFEETDIERDQVFHEFCRLELTAKPVTDARTLRQFVGVFEAMARVGWESSPRLDSLGYALPVGRRRVDWGSALFGQPVPQPESGSTTMQPSEADKPSRSTRNQRNRRPVARKPRR